MGHSYRWEAKKLNDDLNSLYSTDLSDIPIIGQKRRASEPERPEFVFYKEPKSLYHSEHSPFGYMPGEGGIITGSIERLIKYYKKTFRTEYAPLKDSGKNIKGWVSNAIKSWFFDLIESNTGGIVSDLAGGFRETFDHLERNYALDLSPLFRTLSFSYGPGLSYIEKMYLYKKTYGTKTYKVPIYFKTFDKTDGPNQEPTEKQLLEGIDYVDTNLVSPFDNMDRSVSGKLLNRDFIKFSADKYTGNCWNDYFEQEPTNAQRWFCKDDTKGSHLWNRDTAAEALLPASVSPHVEIWNKNVSNTGILYNFGKYITGEENILKSGSMAWAKIKGDFSQDIPYVLAGGALVAKFLENIGVDREGVRIVMEKFYKIGSKIEEGFGNNRWATYNIREEASP